jgi:hypothetical protein
MQRHIRNHSHHIDNIIGFHIVPRMVSSSWRGAYGVLIKIGDFAAIGTRKLTFSYRFS